MDTARGVEGSPAEPRPLVSVVVPVYNAERFLARAVDSVLRQTHREVELLLVDDGSTDGSRARCDAYAAADPRVRVLGQANAGPAAARNAGLRQATGTFVAFLDADDFLDEVALETLVSCQGRTGAEMVLGNFQKLAPDGRLLPQAVSFHPEGAPLGAGTREQRLAPAEVADFVRHFLRHPSNHLISYCWGRLYLLTIIRRHDMIFRDEMRLFEDFVFNLEYLERANGIAFVNAPLYTYVMHASHVSASMAIVNSASLLHDMGVFREVAGGYLARRGAPRAAQEVGHALVHYVIIFLVRTCRLIDAGTRARIRAEIERLVDAPVLRESLPHYAPAPGNSRVVPLLLRLRLVGPLMAVCRRKAYRRYGRPAR